VTDFDGGLRVLNPALLFDHANYLPLVVRGA
jgi:hypothetical protein